jgi:hypothetical protein
MRDARSSQKITPGEMRSDHAPRRLLVYRFPQSAGRNSGAQRFDTSGRSFETQSQEPKLINRPSGPGFTVSSNLTCRLTCCDRRSSSPLLAFNFAMSTSCICSRSAVVVSKIGPSGLSVSLTSNKESHRARSVRGRRLRTLHTIKGGCP